MSKYEVPDDQWQEPDEGNGEQWRDKTSADIEVEVTIHNEGYQTDQRWTVELSELHDGELKALYAGEHQNKGNFWRQPDMWSDAVDFVELPFPARKRVASLFGKSLEEITSEERLIHREDGRGVGDRAAEHSGRCDVCGGRLYEEGDTHEECVGG